MSVQKPVAYAVYHRMGGSKTLHWPEQHSEDGDANDYRLLPLYAAPVAQQEPVAWMHVAANMPSNRHLEWNENHPGYRGDWIKHPLYTTPPAAPVQEKPLFADLIAQHPGLAEELKAMDASPVQEPVAWIFKLNRELLWPHEVERKNPIELNEYVPLYTTPPAAQRQWVGLTDEEVQSCWNDTMSTPDYSREGIYRAIEAKLKEKNHGWS